MTVAAFFGFQATQTDVQPPTASVEQVAQSEDMQTGEQAGDGSAQNINANTDDTTEITDEESVQTGAPIKKNPATVTENIQTMIVAGGCFWCVESDLEKLTGVVSVVSGYGGGSTENPTYQNYGSGGHREIAKVTYDANKVSFEDILIVTMKTTDPTDDDGTFADRGDKYSAAFYYENATQQKIINDLITEVDKFGPYDKPLAIDVESRPKFWAAEDYHQDYYKGTLSKLKYQYYRSASGRDTFIDKYWGANGYTTNLPWRNTTSAANKSYMWSNYQKPSQDELKNQLDPLVYKVTQEEGTERAGSSPLDKVNEDGVFVDALSGEPLYSSKDKFDSGTGWPSFVKPIAAGAVVEKEDRKLFSVRTEIRSAIADNHIGHVFNDGPADRGGLRYCMNGAALKFIPKAEMAEKGYGDFLQYI